MSFSFASPWFLSLLVLIPCFFLCKVNTKHFFFPKIAWLNHQMPLFSFVLWLKIAIYTLMVLALSEPYIYDPASSNQKHGRDLILAIDASGSMAQSGFDKKDRFKSRYEVSIDLAQSFLKSRLDDNIGVVVFGTFAYTASPVTYDLKGVTYLLKMTDVGVAGESTAIGDALMQSLHTLTFGEAKSKVIILFTDGHHNAGKSSPKQAVSAAKKAGVKIYTVGIGNKNDYDAVLLEKIAKETGAKSYGAADADELAKIYQAIEVLEPSMIRSENFLNRSSLAAYPIALALMLLFAWMIWQRKFMRKKGANV